MNISDMLRWIRVSAMVLLVIALAPMTVSCDKENFWNEVPGEIATFINQYYPDSDISSYNYTKEVYHVRLKNGPGLTFDKDQQWVSVNGYGMPIPQILLFDQLPPKLYNYLQETEQLNSVFSISRSKGIYNVSLLQRNLRYDSANEEIIGSPSDGGNGQSISRGEN